MQVIQRRLSSANVCFAMSASAGSPRVAAEVLTGVGYYEISLTEFSIEPGMLPRVITGFDALDSWSVGYMRQDAYHAMARAGRAKDAPAIPLALELPVLSGQPVLRVQDVLGRTFFFEMMLDASGTPSEESL